MKILQGGLRKAEGVQRKRELESSTFTPGSKRMGAKRAIDQRASMQISARKHTNQVPGYKYVIRCIPFGQKIHKRLISFKITKILSNNQLSVYFHTHFCARFHCFPFQLVVYCHFLSMNLPHLSLYQNQSHDVKTPQL